MKTILSDRRYTLFVQRRLHLNAVPIRSARYQPVYRSRSVWSISSHLNWADHCRRQQNLFRNSNGPSERRAWAANVCPTLDRDMSLTSDPFTTAIDNHEASSDDPKRLLNRIKAEIDEHVFDILDFYDEMNNPRVRERWDRQMAFIILKDRSHVKRKSVEANPASSQSWEEGEPSDESSCDADYSHEAINVNSSLMINMENEANDSNAVPNNQRIRFLPTTSSIGRRDETDLGVLANDDDLTVTDSENSSVATGQPNESEQDNQSISKALALLRIMYSKDWHMYDYLDKDDNEDDHDVQIDEAHPQGGQVDTGSDLDVLGDIELMMGSSIDQDTSHDDQPYEGSMESTLVSEIDRFLASVQRGELSLSTDDYNAILARVSVSADLEPDEVSKILLNVYHNMLQLSNLGSSECCPNAMTYEIILLTLNRRLESVTTAIDLVKNMTDELLIWTPELLVAAFHTIQKRNLLSFGINVINTARSGRDKKRFRIPIRVFMSLIRMEKALNAQDDAISTIKMYMKQQRRGVLGDAFLISAIRWPTRDGMGQVIDTTSFLGKILSIVEEKSRYRIGIKVWARFIEVTAHGASLNHARWELVRLAFQSLARQIPAYWPTYKLLKCGLDACTALKDSSLATDIMIRFLNHEEMIFRQQVSSENNHMNLTVNDIVKTMNICIDNRDAKNGRLLVDRCRNLSDSIPKPIRQQLYGLMLRCYAANSDSQSAVALLNEIRLDDLEIREEDCGAVIRAFAINDDYQGASIIFSRIEGGEFNCKPGASCYAAYILANVKEGRWDDALACHEKMKCSNIVSESNTSTLLIIAAYRKGGRQAVVEMIEDLLKSKGTFCMITCMQILDALIPDIGVSRNDSVASLQKKLRALGSSNQALKKCALNLTRAFRIAETEEHHSSAYSDKQQQAWHSVLKLILELSQALDGLD